MTKKVSHQTVVVPRMPWRGRNSTTLIDLNDDFILTPFRKLTNLPFGSFFLLETLLKIKKKKKSSWQATRKVPRHGVSPCW